MHDALRWLSCVTTTEEKTKHKNQWMARGDRVQSFHNPGRHHRNRKECCRDATTGAKDAKVQKTAPSRAHSMTVDVQLCLKLGVLHKFPEIAGIVKGPQVQFIDEIVKVQNMMVRTSSQ